MQLALSMNTSRVTCKVNNMMFFVSDYLFKLLLIGDSGVGKSCLLLRFAVRKTFFSVPVIFCLDGFKVAHPKI